MDGGMAEATIVDRSLGIAGVSQGESLLSDRCAVCGCVVLDVAAGLLQDSGPDVPLVRQGKGGIEGEGPVAKRAFPAGEG